MLSNKVYFYIQTLYNFFDDVIRHPHGGPHWSPKAIFIIGLIAAISISVISGLINNYCKGGLIIMIIIHTLSITVGIIENIITNFVEIKTAKGDRENT